MNKRLQTLLVFSVVTGGLMLSHLSAFAQAQLPNSDFESWTGNTPTGWVTDNNPPFEPITKSTDAHGGSAAAQAAVVSVGPAAIPPALAVGSSSTNHGMVYTDRPTSLSGYYKFTSQGSDVFQVLVAFSKAGTGIGAGGFTTSQTVTDWTAFSVPIYWASGDSPDSANAAISITFASGGSATHAGSVAIVDDLHLGMGGSAVSIQPSASSFALQQNYPNPFNPSTEINYSLDHTGLTTLNVFDVTGREVASVVNSVQSAGAHHVRFDASQLPSGMYYYRLTSGANSVAHSMQLVK